MNFEKLPPICAGFDISAMINGVLHSIPIAVKNMNYPYYPIVSSSGNLRTHSWLLQSI
jgi:hypothetical protein